MHKTFLVQWTIEFQFSQNLVNSIYSLPQVCLRTYWRLGCENRTNSKLLARVKNLKLKSQILGLRILDFYAIEERSVWPFLHQSSFPAVLIIDNIKSLVRKRSQAWLRFSISEQIYIRSLVFFGVCSELTHGKVRWFFVFEKGFIFIFSRRKISTYIYATEIILDGSLSKK